MTNLQINPRKIVQAVLFLTILIVLLMRLQLALTRAFDPDEFAYLHWTWLSLNGYLPYRDFFFYILPGFPWALSPILWLTGDSINFLIASRIFMFLIYGLCAGVVYKMAQSIATLSQHQNTHTPGVWAPILATLIFLTFPVTIDKTIDIRPDMVMLLFYFASALIIFQPQKVRPFKATLLMSGMLFGASIFVFPKIIFGLPALLYLLFSQNFIRPPLALRLRSGLAAKGVAFRTLLPWVLGAGLMGLGFLGYLWVNNLIPQAVTSLTSDALAVTSGKHGFSPLLLFTPYPLIYLSRGGVSLPWAVNTIIWMLGVVGLVILFKINRQWAIFWSLFTAGNILFVLLFPVPYVQYLLPLSVAASVLAAIAIQYLGHSILGLGKNTIPYILVPVLLLPSFFLQYRERVAPGAGNSEQLQVIRDVLRVTKPNESVYDMVGSYVFRPDGYYICCHPYAEFVQKLGTSLPAEVPPGGTKEGPGLNLTKSLIKHQTKFLVMDRVGFVFWQSLEPDKIFMLTNYLPMGNPAAPGTPLSKLYSLGQTFRCINGACVQYDMDGKPAAPRSTNTFTLIAGEKYSAAIQPEFATAMIDGSAVKNGQTVELAAGPHGFTTDQTVQEFRIQLRRN
ncbi:MAG: hypothetical protein Q8L37_02890 [Candidatus Gottesmanbacteria bacterium]|nr:hypothetical protein [Candidatus Gottesmanbacteria bacterium]